VCAGNGVVAIGVKRAKHSHSNVPTVASVHCEQRSRVASGHCVCCYRVCAGNGVVANGVKRAKHSHSWRPSAIVLDIEGTVAPISFVADVMFPHARDNVRSYLEQHFDTPEAVADIDAIRTQVGVAGGGLGGEGGSRRCCVLMCVQRCALCACVCVYTPEAVADIDAIRAQVGGPGGGGRGVFRK
jgi:hypothetical protein